MGPRLMLVDIGNSRVKWGRAEQGRLVAGEAFATDADTLSDNLDFRWRSLNAPDAVYVSNVAGADMAERLAHWVAAHWRIPIHFARTEARACGVINGYERPEQLGVDRWIGLLALLRYYGLPACMVDCGTALTLDVLDAGGRHLGGLIAPGPALMKRSLSQGTQGIRAVEGPVLNLLGRDTAACVETGVLRACAGLVEKSVREAAALLGCTPNLVLSGGDGEAIGRCLAIPYRFDADLVLRGLLTLAERDS